MKNIAIFASGSGSNAQNIIEFFKNSDINISLILTNNPNAFVIKRAENLNIPSYIFDKEEFYNSNKIIQKLHDLNIDLIVLSGFLWLVPENLIEFYNDKIINIHPALLPSYGGKGMYGDKVHKAVIDNKESESGITIHFVNKKYDEGNIIFQAKCKIEKNDTPESLAKKIHELEYAHFPKVINDLLRN